MGKFGFGGFSKKDKSEANDGESSRSGLFGLKKPAPNQNDNPYAQQPAEDAYARQTPYQQAKAKLATGPRGPPAGLPSGPAAANPYGTPPPAYPGSSQVGEGYVNEKLGAAGGYGGNRYDGGRTGPSPAPSQGAARFPTRGPGGYGGLGDDSNKEELFAGAQGKYVGQELKKPAQAAYQPGNTGSSLPGTTQGQFGGYGSTSSYGEQAELTEEELIRQETRAIKQQTQQVRDQSVQSANNAVMALDNMIEVGTGTLARLAQQGEMLYNTEKNLDLAANQSRVADEKISTLKRLNGSMFVPVNGNPFTRKSRQAQREQQIVDTHRSEREQREQTRREAYQATQRMERTFQDLERAPQASSGPGNKGSAERSKYMLSDDDDSDEEGKALALESEKQLDERVNYMIAKMPQVMGIAQSMGTEVAEQNKAAGRLAEKTDVVTESVVVGSHRLGKIR